MYCLRSWVIFSFFTSHDRPNSFQVITNTKGLKASKPIAGAGMGVQAKKKGKKNNYISAVNAAISDFMDHHLKNSPLVLTLANLLNVAACAILSH